MLKETEPHTWDRLKLLMDHDEDRRKETEYQRMFQVKIYYKCAQPFFKS
jgi:hypothetical protein